MCRSAKLTPHHGAPGDAVLRVRDGTRQGLQILHRLALPQRLDLDRAEQETGFPQRRKNGAQVAAVAHQYGERAARTVFAIRPKTGGRVGYYQTLPEDSFDYDAVQTAVVPESRRPDDRQVQVGNTLQEPELVLD